MSAGIEVRQLFPGITDGAKTREMARTIVGWGPVSSVQLPRSRGSVGRYPSFATGIRNWTRSPRLHPTAID